MLGGEFVLDLAGGVDRNEMERPLTTRHLPRQAIAVSQIDPPAGRGARERDGRVWDTLTRMIRTVSKERRLCEHGLKP